MPPTAELYVNGDALRPIDTPEAAEARLRQVATGAYPGLKVVPFTIPADLQVVLAELDRLREEK